jgi:Skp family chaperone for outer membrane proteins
MDFQLLLWKLNRKCGKMKFLGILITVVLITGYGIIDHMFFTPRIAFVNTAKLMVGFSEAAKAEKDIKTEEDKWQGQYKLLQDSVQAEIALISKEYDKASAARKKEMQDMLAARNQQANNYRQASLKKMEEVKAMKMKSVFEKVNVFLAEFGKRHRYSMIFGTLAGGNILYANEQKNDITEKLIKGLNERYK